MHTLTVAEAICEGLREEMERDPRVFLMGEDVGAIGGIFATSRGLQEKFGPERVRDAPDGEGPERIGVAARRREGTDVTLCSYSLMTHRCLEAADLLGQRGVSCEVIDLRTIRPWDKTALLDSVRKTHRLAVVHEAV